MNSLGEPLGGGVGGGCERPFILPSFLLVMLAVVYRIDGKSAVIPAQTTAQMVQVCYTQALYSYGKT